MPDEQKQTQKDDHDEVMVKQADGSFKTMKVAASGATEEIKDQKPAVEVQTALPAAARPNPQQAPTPTVKPVQPSHTGGAWLAPEEEKDVKQVSPELQQAKQRQQRSLDRALDALVAAAGATTLDEAAIQRFRSAVSLRLRGIRDDMETKDALTKSKEQGGLGMDVAAVDRVLELARSMALMEPVSATPPASATPVKQGEVVRVAAPKAESVSQSAKSATLPTQRANPTLPPKAELSSGLEKGRETAENIPSPHLSGPVEELRLSLADWRRLADTTDGRVKKVREKVMLLEQQSFVTRLEGTRAWEESAVMQLYRDIVAEALLREQKIAAVLVEREKNKQPSMNMETFTKIAELNIALRV